MAIPDAVDYTTPWGDKDDALNDAMRRARTMSPVETAAQAYKAPGPLAKWQRARHLAALGLLGRNARIQFKGDSKMMGAGAGTANLQGYLTNGAATKNKPTKVVEGLRRGGYNVTTSMISGYRGMGSPADFMSYDTRVTGIGTWGGGTQSIGGAMFSTSVDALASFVPDEPVNRVSLIYRNTTGRPDMTVGRGNSDPAQTIVPSKPAVAVLTRTDLSFATLDQSAITFGKVAGAANSASIAALIAWNSNKPGIEILVDAVYGINTTTASGYVTDPALEQTSPLNGMLLYAPDLTVIGIGTNDFANTALSTTIANVSSMIDRALVSGSVILLFPAVAGLSNSTSGGTDDARALAKAAYRQLAADKGCVFADEDAVVGGRAVAGSFGAPLFADALHENEGGQAFEGHLLTRLILA